MRSIISTLGLVLFLSFSSVVYAEEDLNSLAREMAMLSDATNEQAILQARSKDSRRYNSLSQRFKQLTISEKNTVLRIGRTLRKNKKSEPSSTQLFLDEVINIATKLAKEDGLFLGDLSEKEISFYGKAAMKKLVPEGKAVSQTLAKSSSGCPLRSFPLWINEVNPDNSTSYFPYTYSTVINNPGESPCDWELWFSTSKSRVWGTSWFAQQLINGGLSKRSHYGSDRLIVGYWSTLFWIGHGSLLVNRVVVW